MLPTTIFENLSPLREDPGKVPFAVSVRNACFDAVFYDTANLTDEEKGQLFAKASDYDEGGMLFVYPTHDRKPIEYFSLSKELVTNHPELDTVTIPGVGSSVIGTASLARQVADVTGRPAVGLIAGYGAADVISEALGGWFMFGIRNRIRSMIADWKRHFTVESSEAQMKKYGVLSATFLVDEPESNTLLNIMLRHANKLRLIVGHSKGSFNIHNVLHAFVKQTDWPQETYRDLTIVTLGCGVDIPRQFKNVHQYIGSLDMLGKLNTPATERHDPSLRQIDGRGHNLCSWNPLHMPVDELLGQAETLYKAT